MSDTIQDKEKKPLKVKAKKPSLKTKENQTHKIDFNKKEEVKEDAIPEQKPDDSNATIEEPKNETSSEAVVEEVRTTEKQEVISPISEVIEEEVKEIEKEHKEAIRDEKVLGKPLPENIEKLVSFMEETGGTVEDYARLNRDYSNIDNSTLLKEYYKNTKPHLDQEEIDFIMEDNFSYDDDVDEERDIKKKKLAFKEEIAKAKNFLEETKSKYYDEIKLRPGVTQEQQKAMDFFNRHNEEQKMVKQQHDKFKSTTKNFFNQEFKGFEFNLSDKKFRYGVNDVDSVASNQSDLTNLIGKFLDNKGEVKDYKGYHKAIFAAQNADTIANHFYEQGKADAIKDVMAKSKNLNNELRPTSTGDVFIQGMKVKAISGVDSSKLKLRINKNK